MKNSDTLKFDYWQPVTQLPHDLYKLYIKDEKYTYQLCNVYRKNEVCNIPAVLDQLYYPDYVGFLIVGYIKDQEQDEIIDSGNIVQRRENKKK